LIVAEYVPVVVAEDRGVYRQEILDYLYVMAVPAVFLFLLACAFFPARPPTPPSTSSAEER
jgi:hypothetical protein